MKSYTFDYTNHLEEIVPLLQELEQKQEWSSRQFSQIVNRHAQKSGDIFSKDMIVMAYRALAGTHGLKALSDELIQNMQMKPTRTLSGVTPVTVLTKPFPCPGKCIFCPNDIRMPKSYLADEPGAQRAERNSFDPYLQTYNRLLAFKNIGHRTDKIELIILGGTWSYYPEPYQIWFVKECFRALNDFHAQTDDRARIEKRYDDMRTSLKKNHDVTPSNNPSENKDAFSDRLVHGQDLKKSYNQVVSEIYTAPERVGGFDQYQSATWEELLHEHKRNEVSECRNVGLVIETRPDNISEAEVLRIRRLGCTKTQIGFQSLQDDVLEKNKRGHTVAATRRAVNLLRQAGFKIHAHWMPNLYGSTPEKDKKDYEVLFQDLDFKPDELKIYPCSLIESAELMQYYQRGEWRPYSDPELLDVLTFSFRNTPEYCRLTRVIRDIPSTDIVVGNKKTNFRQIAELELTHHGEQSKDIRSREIRGEHVEMDDLELVLVPYETSVSHEIFLQFVKKTSPTETVQKIIGFLRLSLPTVPNFISELHGAAIIREVHVYGQTVGIGKKAEGNSQHLGLGTLLLEKAKEIATEKGYKKIAVISAIGTREYYRRRGFHDGELYQSALLTT